MNNDVEDIEISIKEKNCYVQRNIKAYMQKGLSFEKENKIEEAIKCYEEALSLYDFKKNGKEIFELCMKVGDLYQISGQIDNGLHCFEKAYNTTVILDNKFLKVDALIKIAESYISKGEIETSAKYTDIVDSILCKVEYIKGKIENSICWARIFYIKKEFFKAREICNEALKLCGDEYPFYKGRILITLVELYKDITSVEEHLGLLNQAYECFEKVNDKRGMLGTINNIAVVYADKLQDYEKTLEHFNKLKELSENSIYVEFHKISYLNLGEIYSKCFKYDKALYWLNEALKNPIGAYTDNILVYNYAYLSLANLRLCNYDKAYDIFVKASEEVNKNFSAESTLVQYYKVAAMMFMEFGENNKAIAFVKQALDAVGKDETMIKWNIGLVYEHIKLREFKNETDLIGILEGIKYTISKYLNIDEILDAVYDTVIELISSGNYELAFNFLKDYNSMESKYDYVRLKKIYIDIKQNEFNNCNDIELFNSALELAKQTNNSKINWKLCSSIGDYYVKIRDFKNAINYYNAAYNLVKKMVLAVPEKYRTQYINYSKSLEPFNKLSYAKKQI